MDVTRQGDALTVDLSADAISGTGVGSEVAERAVQQLVYTATAAAQVAGTPARTVTILVAPGYAPFEQYYSSGENQGPWTDLYSLGATCYRAIAGIAPMDAISRSKGILGSTREILIPAVTIGSGRYSPPLLKAIDHALQFAEKDRPQTIADWRRELTAGSKPAARAAPATISVTPATAPGRASSRSSPRSSSGAGATGGRPATCSPC